MRNRDRDEAQHVFGGEEYREDPLSEIEVATVHRTDGPDAVEHDSDDAGENGDE